MQKKCKKIISFFFFLLFISNITVPALAVVNYSYDANGNVTSDGNNCYEYNNANQVARVKKCSTNQLLAEYIYDASGKRAIKKEYQNGILVNTVYTVDQYFESNVSNTGTKQDTSYYYANDELVARKDPDGKKIFYHTDNLGSTNVLTDESGNTVEQTQYYPFGETKQGGTKSKYLYTALPKDQETNLYYASSRYYNPLLKSFNQPDSIIPNVYDPQQLNRYSYVRNNPLVNKDPSGHYIDTALDVIFISMDIDSIQNDPHNLWNWAALTVDVAAAFIPGVTGAGLGVRAIEALGVGDKLVESARAVGVTEKAVETTRVAEKAVETEDTLKSFTSANFRDNLKTFTGVEQTDAQAHHIFPQKFEEQFKAAGINIHDPQYGSWWEVPSHQQNAYQYNQEWPKFLETKPSSSDILNKGIELGNNYNFPIYYQNPY